jgi:hypothetical protein
MKPSRIATSQCSYWLLELAIWVPLRKEYPVPRAGYLIHRFACICFIPRAAEEKIRSAAE